MWDVIIVLVLMCHFIAFLFTLCFFFSFLRLSTVVNVFHTECLGGLFVRREEVNYGQRNQVSVTLLLANLWMCVCVCVSSLWWLKVRLLWSFPYLVYNIVCYSFKKTVGPSREWGFFFPMSGLLVCIFLFSLKTGGVLHARAEPRLAVNDAATHAQGFFCLRELLYTCTNACQWVNFACELCLCDWTSSHQHFPDSEHVSHAGHQSGPPTFAPGQSCRLLMDFEEQKLICRNETTLVDNSWCLAVIIHTCVFFSLFCTSWWC